MDNINSVNFSNGNLSQYANTNFEANLLLQFTSDGTTWTNSGWTVSPTYPYTNSAAGIKYTFTGTAVSGKTGARIVGQVNTPAGSSAEFAIKELEVYSTTNGARPGKSTPNLGTVNDKDLESVYIFPNPANNVLNITTKVSNAKITLISISGKIIKNINMAGNNAIIDISNLSAGTYIVRVNSKSGTISRKVVIEK